jgi:rod shape-determining protein MreC
LKISMKNHLSKNTAKFVAVIAMSLAIVFLNPAGVFNPVRRVLVEISYPFQKMFYLGSYAISDAFGILGSIGELKNENARLLRENNLLAVRVAENENEKKENAMLRDQLNLAPRKKFDLVASFIIGQDPQRLGSWILIDKGETDGMAPGMPVIAFEGIIIGKIEEIYRDSSKVTLLTDSESAVNASDAETGARGILKGEYNLGIILDRVAQTEALNVGDTVVTSGLGGDLPKGLLIGKILEIRTTGDKLFQQAIVSPRIKYADLESVFVIKK